ncbi:MAG: GNAT family N-acetyltransferase [Candidatus Melainabacteria bacterium]|nr:GNAT family N-acetyltransferase [Candidatus Melainabacteria bacterium]
MMNNTIKIKQIFENQEKLVGDLLHASCDYFSYEPTIKEYCSISNSKDCITFVASNDRNENLGVLCKKMTTEFTSEVIVMSVNPSYRRTGIGSLLLSTAESESIKNGNAYMMAKIIGPSQKSPSALNTYNFFLKQNYCLLAEYDFIWQDCYCGIIAKQIC